MRGADAGLVAGGVLLALWVVSAAVVLAGHHLATAVRTPVLAATGAAVVLLAGHVAVVDAVEDHSAVALLDAPGYGWSVTHRTGALTGVMTVVSTIGDAGGMVVLAAVALVLLLRRRRRAEAVVVVVATGGAELLSQGAKFLYARERPPVEGRLVPETSSALPSGHSLGAVVVIGLVAAIAVLSVQGRVRRAAIGAGAAVAVLLIGESRLYLGVHWPTDIASGYLLGGAWLALCIGAVVLVRRRTPLSAPTEPVVIVPAN